MTESKIIGLYDRVSTDEQNIEKSIDMLKDHAKRHGYKIRTYKDFDVSSKIEIYKRPEGGKLIKDIESGKLCGLIVPRWDRITRVLKHGIDFLEFWDKYKFKFLSVLDGEFLGTPDNIFIFQLKCLLAEKELNDLAWRRSLGIQHTKKYHPEKYKGRPKGSLNKSNPKYKPQKK